MIGLSGGVAGVSHREGRRKYRPHPIYESPGMWKSPLNIGAKPFIESFGRARNPTGETVPSSLTCAVFGRKCRLRQIWLEKQDNGITGTKQTQSDLIGSERRCS
ncbi:MAG: hypothetical protein AB7W37_14790 [Syntrophobacteraceae bacterium]